ncbi:MAG: hypothetical protein U5K31_09180 [Balneolaceae bacterium]|nr:hypothetical protein [Balneolaceae bacterium]
MMLRIVTIVALLVFLFLLMSGSSVEPAMVRSVTVFIALVVGTRVCSYLLNVIKQTSTSTNNQESSPSHN